MKSVIIFGPPGSGKGTMSKIISRQESFRHISTGDLLRNEIASGTPLGKEAKSKIDAGQFVPDNLVIDIVGNIIKATAEANTCNGFMFDGFPRTIPQANKLDELMEQYNLKIDLVLSLEGDNEEFVTRMQKRAIIEGRNDDKDINVIRNRFVEYDKKTQPILDYYEKRELVVPVNCMEDIENVSISIKEILVQKNIL